MNLKTLEPVNFSTVDGPLQTGQTWKLVLYRIFKFFASLKLAILVLLSLMAVFAAGTFIESAHGSEAASLLIYQSSWFSLLLFLLGINVAASALDRFPWKKKHTGFVITHIGILLILAGSFITRKFMVDGQMAITEGETEYRIMLPEPVLYIHTSGQNEKEWAIPVKKHPFSWQGNQPVQSMDESEPLPFKVALLSYLPKSLVRENLIETKEGPAALKVTLHNSFVDQSQWLVENHAELGSVQVGPAKLRFTNELLKENKETTSETSYLEFQFPKTNAQISLQSGLKLPASFPLEGTPYRISILRLFKNAVVVGSQLVDQASPGNAENNPAVELLLEGPELKEKHTVFSKYPDFPTMHGMKPSATEAHIYYRMPGAGGSRGAAHELRFVKQGENLLYQIQTGAKIETGKIILDKEIKTGWMGDLTFKADTFYPHSEMSRTFSAEEGATQNPEAHPAIQLQITKGGEKKSLWVSQNNPSQFEWDNSQYRFLFGQKEKPMGFRLELRDFKMEHYPGTNNPASFESDVTLKDDIRGIQKDVTISMNKPLIYRGYSIYQSGYSQSEGQPDVSVFAIGRDPGVPVKYLGAIVMVTGMIIMFSMKRFSTNAGNLQ